MLQLLKNRISVKSINLPKDFSVIAYGKGMELPAYSLERSIINLEGRIVKTVPIHELTLMEDTYAEPGKIILFINDQNESREVLDNTWALNLEGYLFSCGEIKAKGKVGVFKFNQDLCEINLSLSILYTEASLIKGVRGNRILQDMDFSDIDDFVAEKSKDIDLSLMDIVLSPILLPSRYFVEKNLNKDVKDYYSVNFLNDANIIYTGVDSIPMRRISFELRKKGKKVKEVLLDVEPLLAPIYLSLMTYYMMEG
ncbi:hypothetical protein [Acidianus sp. HS-5]|uniref:hypothetical protein n=1 Tax=Acidianus sp. HS-5 TaxID=2886040 RepID=UPI001F2D8EBA|nr:hypothetical protein [Acidianus sp. HS-5]